MPIPSRLLQQDLPLAYLFLRLSMGVNMVPHGGIRFQYLHDFAMGVVEQFADLTVFGITILPSFITYPYAILLCFVEFAIGIMLVLGYQTRLAAAIGAGMMVTLMFGKAVLHEWGAVGGMWSYILVFFLLIVLSSYDKYSLDSKLAKKM